MEICLLCGESLELANKPTNEVKRGIDALRNASRLRGDTAVFEKLEGIRCLKVHTTCRKNYTRPTSVKASSVMDQELFPQCTSQVVRSDTDHGFDIKNHCLFCGNDPTFRASTKLPTKYRKVIHEVRTLSIKESIEKQALSRNDQWGHLVSSRIAAVGDLVAAEAKYCHDCHLRFFTLKNTDLGKGLGESSLKYEAFLKLCSYMESCGECQFSIVELMDKMKEFLEDQDGYSAKHLLRKLDAHYCNQISISNVQGQNSIITFSGYAKKILVDSWYESRKRNEVDERRRIVETAARIVREDVRKMVYDTTAYPSSADLSVESMMNLIPETLQCFLEIIIQSKSDDKSKMDVKRISIAQALISACRSRSFLSPILNSLGMYIHRKHASKQLIDLLNSVGFSSSYNEIQRYEYSLMEQGETCHGSDEFIQFIFDNADFNVRTLNGHGTFHAMGGVKCTTPAPVPAPICVPRIMKVPSAAEIAAKGEFPLQWYKKPSIPGLKSVIIKDVTISQCNPDVNTHYSLDLLWLSSIFIPAPLSPRPHWNGFMQSLYESCGSGSRSAVDALPFINLDYKEYLSFELAPKPPSLFDGPSMRKTAKSALADILSGIVPCTNITPVNSHFVVDGGCLLHQVVWSRPSTYEQICNSYVNYITSHFGVNRSELVFDGYDGPPTTKYAEQIRRGNRFKAADAVFDLHSIATAKQEDFLANSNNKSRLIAALMCKMGQAGVKTRQAAADADTLIVSAAIEKASQGETVVVVGTDTDLLALLVSRCDPCHSMYFLKPGAGVPKIFNISNIQQNIGDMKDAILFLHASTGCDTTSALYKKGKRTAWKLLNTSEDLRANMKIFNMAGANHSELAAAGEKFLLHLYGGGDCKTLNELRYFTLHKQVARQKVSASFDLASLPPTSEASSLHFFRVYLQVQQWLGNQQPPTDWGWSLVQGNLFPIPSNRPPAPEQLLKLIACNCKATCSGNCDCRRAGIVCSSMCSHCRGIECVNSPPPFTEEETKDDVAGQEI